MGVYIKDMKAPEDCEHCRFNMNYCAITNGIIDGWGRCTVLCPIIEVDTPHGNLVDINTLKIESDIFTNNVVINAPIIIPEEKE